MKRHRAEVGAVEGRSPSDLPHGPSGRRSTARQPAPDTRVERPIAIGIVIAASVLAIAGTALVPAVPQDPLYHRMADDRRLLGIPNALNVVSNVGFVAVGALGLWAVVASDRVAESFVDRRERWPWVVFLVGVALTGLGSAYYHVAPNNDRLVWDRLPLAASVMGLCAAVIAERIGVRTGLRLLAPLMLLGLASVMWWHATEQHGEGDLRLYGLVQFYPLIAIPMMLVLFPPRYTLAGALVGGMAMYGVAKVFEILDGPIFRAGHVVSGHTLKHVAAAAAGAMVVWMLCARRPRGRPDGECR